MKKIHIFSTESIVHMDTVRVVAFENGGNHRENNPSIQDIIYS